MTKHFYYKVINKKHQTVSGHITASSLAEAKSKLINDKNTILEVKPKLFYMSFSSHIFTKKIPPEEIISFTRQLHTLFIAGIPLLECLKLLLSLIKDKSLRKILEQIIISLKKGSSLSTSLSNYPQTFSKEYVTLIKAGETSSSLGDILADLYQLMHWEKQLKQKIWNSLRYPLIVISAAMLAIIAMFNFVIPKFAKMFANAKQELPTPTKIILALSNFFTNNRILIVIIILTIIVTIFILNKIPKTKKLLSLLMLNIPVFGKIYQKYLITRFCKVFAILYQRGIAVLPTLQILKNTSKNTTYQFDLEYLISQIQTGQSLGQATQHTFLFKGTVSHMAELGTKTSKLGIMLEKISELYTEDINYILENIFAYIEPLFIIIIGAFIVILAFGLLMPIWNMAQVIMN
ncbi:type II secretion system F family protein [bacterium]|nr:type II secretion system F family protein [bacterium]